MASCKQASSAENKSKVPEARLTSQSPYFSDGSYCALVVLRNDMDERQFEAFLPVTIENDKLVEIGWNDHRAKIDFETIRIKDSGASFTSPDGVSLTVKIYDSGENCDPATRATKKGNFLCPVCKKLKVPSDDLCSTCFDEVANTCYHCGAYAKNVNGKLCDECNEKICALCNGRKDTDDNELCVKCHNSIEMKRR